jgi:hypothetical protein
MCLAICVCSLHLFGDLHLKCNFKWEKIGVFPLYIFICYKYIVSQEFAMYYISVDKYITEICIYGVQRHLKSWLLTHEMVNICQNVVRPDKLKQYMDNNLVRWTRLCTFERKCLHKIYGPMQQREKWRIRYYQVLYQHHQSPDIIGTITVVR